MIINWPILTIKTDNQWQIAFGQKSLLAKSGICFIALSYQKFYFWKYRNFFCLFQDFQGPRPKLKDFPGPGNFFPNSRIFKDPARQT